METRSLSQQTTQQNPTETPEVEEKFSTQTPLTVPELEYPPVAHEEEVEELDVDEDEIRELKKRLGMLLKKKKDKKKKPTKVPMTEADVKRMAEVDKLLRKEGKQEEVSPPSTPREASQMALRAYQKKAQEKAKVTMQTSQVLGPETGEVINQAAEGYMPFDAQKLLGWCLEALKADLVYHRTRSDLRRKFMQMVGSGRFMYDMPMSLFTSISTTLMSRSEGMNDDKILAFTTAITQMIPELQTCISHQYQAQAGKVPEDYWVSLGIDNENICFYNHGNDDGTGLSLCGKRYNSCCHNSNSIHIARRLYMMDEFQFIEFGLRLGYSEYVCKAAYKTFTHYYNLNFREYDRELFTCDDEYELLMKFTALIYACCTAVHNPDDIGDYYKRFMRFFNSGFALGYLADYCYMTSVMEINRIHAIKCFGWTFGQPAPNPRWTIIRMEYHNRVSKKNENFRNELENILNEWEGHSSALVARGLATGHMFPPAPQQATPLARRNNSDRDPDEEDGDDDHFVAQSGIFNTSDLGINSANKISDSLEHFSDAVVDTSKEMKIALENINRTAKSVGDSVYASTTQINSAATQIKTSTDNLNESVNKLSENGVNLNHNITVDDTSPFIASMTSLLQTIRDKIDPSKGSTLYGIEQLIGTLTTLWSYYRAESYDLKATILVTYVTLSHSSSAVVNLGPALFSSVSALSCWLKGKMQVAQDSTDDTLEAAPLVENVFVNIIKIIKGFFTFQTPYEMALDQKRRTYLMSSLTLLKKTGDIYTFTFDLFKNAIYTLYEWIYGVPYVEDNCKKLLSQMTSFVSKAETFLMKDITTDVNFNHQLVYECEQLVKEAQSIAKGIMNEATLMRQATPFFNVQRRLIVLYDSLFAFQQSQKTRHVPTCVLFHGPPGVGKSVVEEIISKVLCDVFNRPYGPLSVYTKHLLAKFWSAYRNQFITIMDDVWQMDNLEYRQLFISWIIQLVNSGTVLLDMAEAELKAKTLFTSDFLLLSSNSPAMPPDDQMGVQSPEAVKRRIHLCYYVTTIDHYNKHNGQIFKNGGAPPAIRDSSKLDVSDYLFFKHDLINDQIDHRPMKFEELMEEIVKKYLVMRQDANDVRNTLIKDTTTFAPLEEALMNKFPDIMKFRAQGGLDDPTKEELEKKFKRELTPEQYEAAMRVIHEFEEEEKQEQDLHRELVENRTGFIANARKELASMRSHIKEFILRIAHSKIAGVEMSTIFKALAAVGVLVGLFAGGKAIKDYYSSKEDYDELYEGQSSTRSVALQQRHRKPATTKPKSYNFVSQGDDNAEDVIDHVVTPNLFTFAVQNLDGTWVHCEGLFLFNHTFVTVKHVPKFQSLGPKIRIYWRGGTWEIPKEDLRMRYDQDQDLAIGTFDHKSMLSAKNIIKHFVSDDDLYLALGMNLTLVLADSKKVRIFNMTKPEWIGELEYELKSGFFLKCARVFKGVVMNRSGFCGGVYVVNNSAYVRKILGLHISGCGRYGCGTVVTQEWIRAAMLALFGEMQKAQSQSIEPEKLQYEGLYRNPLEDATTEKVGFSRADIVIKPYDPSQDKVGALELAKEENFEIIGLAEPEVFIPGNHHRKPSPIYGCFRETKEFPAILKPIIKDGEKLDPALISMKPSARSVHKVSEEDCHLLMAIADKISDTIPTVFPPRNLSKFEALNGVPGFDYMESIKLANSIGYPRNTQNLGKGKTAFYDNSQGFVQMTKILAEEYDDFLTKLKSDDKSLETIPIFCNNLKDERLPLEKINTANTRLMSSPLNELFIAQRQYFGAFYLNTIASHNDTYSAIGINPHSWEWQNLYLRLMKFGDPRYGIAGDFKKWDKNAPLILFRAAQRVIENWYARSESNDIQSAMIRRKLHKMVHSPVMIMRNLVYKLKETQPSGHLLTTPENNLAVYIALVFLIYKEMESHDWTIEMVLDHIAEKFFGDDHTLVFSPELAKHCNMRHIQKNALKYLGLVYTSVFKDKEVPEFMDITEMSFIGRTFRCDNGLVFAPLTKENIEDMVNWVDTTVLDEFSCLKAVCDTALLEAFHWGRDYFDWYKKKLNASLEEIGLERKTITYDEILCAFLGQKINFVAQSGTAPKQTTNLEQNEQVTSPTATELTETVSFGDNVGKASQYLPVDNKVLKTGTDPYPDQGMKTVLSRVYKLEFDWSGANAQGAQVFTCSFPASLLGNPNITEKLNRFQFFRANTHISVRLNGTTMHFGALQISWMPHYINGGGAYYPNQTMVTSSCLPNMIASCNTNTTTEIEIPYCAPARYWNMKDNPLVTADGFFGRIFVHVLAPCRLIDSAIQANLKVTLWVHFEDPEPAGLGLRATVPPFKAQSGNLTGEQVSKSSSNMLVSTVKGATTRIRKVVGPLTEGIDKLMDAFSVATKFDKPTSVESVTKIRNDINSGLALGNGLDHVDKLAISPENGVATDTSIYPDNADYNLFGNYKLLPGLIKYGSFNGTAQSGDVIFKIPVTPTYCKVDTTIEDQLFQLTPVGNLASYFAYWTGSLKYHITFYTSKFITGRVTLKWVPDPTYNGAFANNTFGDTVAHTIDITGDTSYSMNCPYLREKSWEKVLTPYDATIDPITTWTGFNGQLVLEVTNPLAVQTSASQAIVYYTVHMSGGEDFSVARPTLLNSIDYTDGTQAPTVSEKVKFVAQSGTQLSCDIRELFRKSFPTMIPTTLSHQTGVSMGESVSTWQELLHRYVLLQTDTVNTEGSVIISPYGTLIPPHINFHRRIMRSFHYMRGSFRIKAFASCDAGPVKLAAANYSTEIDAELLHLSQRGMAITQSDIRPFIEVEIPFYYAFDMFCQSRFSGEHSGLPMVQIYAKLLKGTGTITIETYFSVGDDFTMGFPVNPVVLKKAITPAPKEEKDDDNNNVVSWQ